MSDIIKLEIEGHAINHQEQDDGTPLYPGVEVAKAFGFANPHEALREHVDPEDRVVLSVSRGVSESLTPRPSGGKQKKIFITGIGVQTLAFRSKLPRPREYTRRVAAHMEAIRLGKVEASAERDLEVKVKAFIAEKTREWELTFQRRYYNELDRLSGFRRTHPNKHPPIYGLVTAKIYELLDPDIADHLRLISRTQPKVAPSGISGFRTSGERA